MYPLPYFLYSLHATPEQMQTIRESLETGESFDVTHDFHRLYLSYQMKGGSFGVRSPCPSPTFERTFVGRKTALELAFRVNRTLAAGILARSGDLYRGRVDIASGLDTPLACAVDMERVDLVDQFLALGASPDYVGPDPSSMTPLMRACEAGNIDIVQRLLEAGANPSHKTSEGKTPLSVACVASYAPGILERLLIYGADFSGLLFFEYAKVENLEALRALGINLASYTNSRGKDLFYLTREKMERLLKVSVRSRNPTLREKYARLDKRLRFCIQHGMAHAGYAEADIPEYPSQLEIERLRRPE